MYHVFPSKIFCLTLPKDFVRESFKVSENLGYWKVLCIKRGWNSILLKTLCLTMPKNLVREPVNVSGTLTYWNFSFKEGGGHHGFVENCLSHRNEAKTFVCERFCVSENFGNRKVLFIKRGYNSFPMKIIWHALEKNFVREPFSVSGDCGYRIHLCRKGLYRDFLS